VTTIAVFPNDTHIPPRQYRAVAGDAQAAGATVGQAVDALAAQLDADGTTLIVVQKHRPDSLFPADRRDRLEHLMTKWRTARDAGQSLPVDEGKELDALVAEELAAATARAAALLPPGCP
jgi:hypothetical protein